MHGLLRARSLKFRGRRGRSLEVLMPPSAPALYAYTVLIPGLVSLPA